MRENDVYLITLQAITRDWEVSVLIKSARVAVI